MEWVCEVPRTMGCVFDAAHHQHTSTSTRTSTRLAQVLALLCWWRDCGSHFRCSGAHGQALVC